MFAKQFYWYKLTRAFVQTWAFEGFSVFPHVPFVSFWAPVDWLAPGGPMGAGNPTTSGRSKPRSGRLPAPAAPQGAVLGIIYIYYYTPTQFLYI